VTPPAKPSGRGDSEIVKALATVLKAALRCCPEAHRDALLDKRWRGMHIVVGLCLDGGLPIYNVECCCEEEVEAALEILRTTPEKP
jgi:hypothetical protein